MAENTSEDKNDLREWLIGTKQQPGLLAKLGVSVEQFADGIGLRRATIYYFLNDTNRPSYQSLSKMCGFLGVPLQVGLQHVTPRREGRPVRSKDGKPRVIGAKTIKQLKAGDVLKPRIDLSRDVLVINSSDK